MGWGHTFLIVPLPARRTGVRVLFLPASHVCSFVCSFIHLTLGLCTSTRFIGILVNMHRYQNRYGYSYSFNIHFDMFLTRYTGKMQEIYVLLWTVLKTSVLTCKQSASALLRRCEIVTACENSRDFLLRRCWGSHSSRHFPIKTMFLL